MRQVVHLHAVGHVPHTTPAVLEFIGDEAYLVAALDQALPQLVAMRLNTAELGEGEVCDY